MEPKESIQRCSFSAAVAETQKCVSGGTMEPKQMLSVEGFHALLLDSPTSLNDAESV